MGENRQGAYGDFPVCRLEGLSYSPTVIGFGRWSRREEPDTVLLSIGLISASGSRPIPTHNHGS